MKDFLKKEAVTGQLNGIFPPENRTDLWGQLLWKYLNKCAAFMMNPATHNHLLVGWPTKPQLGTTSS